MVTKSLERYDVQKAALETENFVNDLSLWFVRRSRDRIGPTTENSKDKNDCYETLYSVLVTLSKLLSPFTPFLAEEIFTNLTDEESVHLSDWPEFDKKLIKKSYADTNHWFLFPDLSMVNRKTNKILGIKITNLKKALIKMSKKNENNQTI